ncbi:hypothetical protein BDF22DRAFT_175472 [Syncephalis plumigaleata]|nr:hypothetical protein BDF22DRAFT_175472 [Syncephalis plumigaleata]
MTNMEPTTATTTTTTTTTTTAIVASDTTIVQDRTMSKSTASGDRTEETLGAGATGERKPASPGATATTASSLLPDPNWKPTATPSAAPPANAAPRRAFGATKGPRRLSDLKEVDENATESSDAASSSAALAAALASVDSDSLLAQRRPSAPGFGKFTGLGLPFQNTSIWKEQSSINRLRPSAGGVDVLLLLLLLHLVPLALVQRNHHSVIIVAPRTRSVRVTRLPM